MTNKEYRNYYLNSVKFAIVRYKDEKEIYNRYLLYKQYGGKLSLNTIKSRLKNDKYSNKAVLNRLKVTFDKKEIANTRQTYLNLVISYMEQGLKKSYMRNYKMYKQNGGTLTLTQIRKKYIK